MRFVYEIWRDAFYYICWFGNFFDWNGRRHEFVVNETMTYFYIRYYKCLFVIFADFEIRPSDGSLTDRRYVTDIHLSIYDYDIKLETTKILVHVFDKV